MDRNTALKDHIAAQAADWFVQLQDAHGAQSTRDEFVRWLLQSPEHLEEFLAISRVWGETNASSAARTPSDELIAVALKHKDAAENIVALHGTSPECVVERAASASKRARRRFSWAAAAALIVAIGGTLAWLVADRWLNPAYIRTEIGEQRSIALADGSMLHVNTDSEVRVGFNDTQRHVRLLRGEARFKVSKDSRRPFIVATPQASIRALGTIFNVRAEPRRTAVAVFEGRVEVRETIEPKPNEGGDGRIELQAGEQAAVNPSGHIVPAAGPPLERVAAWTERRLVFREELLSEVVAEFNRYHRKPIVIETPQLAKLRISGTFDASDPDSLVEYFARFEHVRVERNAVGTKLFLSKQ
jgi:transmembrane sensor